MATLQIPFSRWDWPNLEASSSDSNDKENDQKIHNHHNDNHPGYNNFISTNNNHRSDVQNCSHPRSNPIAASLSSLSAMLLEGQAVLAHQTSNAIWLFIGLNSGAIWKWTINSEAFARNEISELQAELVMTAHKSPIKALTMSKYRVDCTGEVDEDESNKIQYIESLLSVDETGELAVWNCHDGRCILHNLRATATGKSAGYPNSISVSPNYEFCILAGFSDKLVVLRLATLEIVQIVEVSGGKMPRWVRAAGFLLQDDPNLLLDYLTLNFNAPATESLTARQFDPKIGKFVSPACPILPSTIPSEQLAEFSTCHLLTCSRANPGLAALVTKLHHVWLVDFLSGDFVQFSLDFEIDGVEFLGADLLLVWSKTGKLSFYNVFIQSTKSENNEDFSEAIRRSRSPILGHVVRKLDMKSSFPFGNRLHLKLLSASNETNVCSSLLWIESINCPQRKTQVSVVKIEFDSNCPDRTVHLHRENDLSLPLLFNDASSTDMHKIVPLTPVTCTITMEPDWLIQGHFDGRISRKNITNFFVDNIKNDESEIIHTSLLEDVQPSFNNIPITTLSATISSDKQVIITAGDAQGQLQFWKITENKFHFLGASRCHIKKIIGIAESGGSFYSWSADGVVGMYKMISDDGVDEESFKCVHLFNPPGNNLGLTGLYWRVSNEGTKFLLLDYRTMNSSTTIIHSHWNISLGCKLPDLSDSDYFETLSMSYLKIQVEGLGDGFSSQPAQPYRSPENCQLFSGVISVLGDGRQWPELPCHTLLLDIRLLTKQLAKKRNFSHSLQILAKCVLSQFLAWGVSDRMDIICKEILGLTPNSRLIRSGLLGANGNVSLILNPPIRDRFWTISPTQTASLQLAVVLLLGAIPWEVESEHHISTLVTFYAAQIGDITKNSIFESSSLLSNDFVFRPGALSFISKFWQDPDPEIQKSARILFSSTLARLSATQRSGLIDYWKDYLPSSNSVGSTSDGRSVHRSAIILGIIGIHEPDSLSKSIKKHVAESLVGLLLDGKRNIFRLAAVELIGRGYVIWSPFIHGASIFKLLHSWLIQLYGGDEQFYQTILRAIINILTSTVPIPVVPDAPDATANEKQLQLTPNDLSKNLNESLASSSISRKSSSSTLFTQSKTQTSINPSIAWLTELITSLQGSREVSSIERKCSLEILKNLLSSKPVIFKGHEHLLVEIIMKLGDWAMLKELDEQFGVISLHVATQRLAVPLADNTISVFDLKSGNRIALLQGHVHPCTLVIFNPERSDGKQLLSYSADEACVRWWNISSSSSGGTSSSISGLFSSFSGHHETSTDSPRPGAKPVKVIIVQPELTEAIDCIPPGSFFKLNPINVTWNIKAKIVEFRVGVSLVQTLSIP